MKKQTCGKITITLPASVYHKLRHEARRQGLSLPEFVRSKITLQPSGPTELAKLPLKQIIRETAPEPGGPDSRLDFFS